MYTLVSKPTSPIIKLEEVKNYLKIEHNLEDGLILSLIDAAEDAANKYMLQYIRRTTFQYFEESSASIIELRRARFASIDSVSIFSGNEWQKTDDFEIMSSSDIYGVVRIGTSHSAVKITFSVGDNHEVPPALKTAILIIIANMYENRGDDADFSVIPQMAKQILNGYRVIRAR